jgi:hypothetical protein
VPDDPDRLTPFQWLNTIVVRVFIAGLFWWLVVITWFGWFTVVALVFALLATGTLAGVVWAANRSRGASK